MAIGVYTSICEEDACWIDQYLSEIERLGLRFAIHFDRCSKDTRSKLYNHPLFLGNTSRSNPSIEFNEKHKQGAFNILVAHKFDWAMAWDMDETWEILAPKKLQQVEQLDADYVDCPWYNLWDNKQHIRVDGGFHRGHRVKFYRLRPEFKWRFNHKITNGLTGTGTNRPPVLAEFNLVCLHHGMMTEELRLQHKERWDRIYTAAVGNNPYGFWDDALDKSIKPITVKHGY